MKKRVILRIAYAFVVFVLSLSVCAPHIAAAAPTAYDLASGWASGGYPGDLGGAYCIARHETDTGTDSYLVYFVLVGATDARKAEIRAMVSDPENVFFTDGKYTYSELRSAQDRITAMMDGESGILECGIYDDSNAVFIGVAADKLEYYKALFAEEFGDMVRVEESSVIELAVTEIALFSEGGEKENLLSRGGALPLLFVVSAAAVIVAGTAVVFRRRRVAAVRTADGIADVIPDEEGTARAKIGLPVAKAVKSSNAVPDDGIYAKIEAELNKKKR